MVTYAVSWTGKKCRKVKSKKKTDAKWLSKSEKSEAKNEEEVFLPLPLRFVCALNFPPFEARELKMMEDVRASINLFSNATPREWKKTWKTWWLWARMRRRNESVSPWEMCLFFRFHVFTRVWMCVCQLVTNGWWPLLRWWENNTSIIHFIESQLSSLRYP